MDRNTIHNEFSRIVNGSSMILCPTTVSARMPGLNTIDAQHTVPLASLNHINAGVGTYAVIVEQPLNINGQVAIGDETHYRHGILNICWLIPEIKGRNFGWYLGKKLT